MPTRWAARNRHGGRRRPSRRRTRGSRSPRSAQTPRQPGGRTRGDGLPRMVPDARSRIRARRRSPGVERLALGRQPPRVAMHREQLGTAAHEPEGDVHVRGTTGLLRRVADDDRRDGGPGAASASSSVSIGWPANSRRASSAASTNSGRPGSAARVQRRRGRERRLESGRGSIGAARSAEPAGKGLAADCEKFVTTRNGMPRSLERRRPPPAPREAPRRPGR